MLRALRKLRDQAPELQPWSLKFTDGWLERRFQDAYFDTNLQYIRIATFLGAVTWAAFGPLAPVIVKEGGSVGAYVLERSTRLLFLRERELDRERGRSEGLLRNIFPEQIADRLKQRDPATEHGAIAQAYTEVTVVFADLVEFTKQSGRTDPPEIVAVLDDVFTRFDAIAERCGLEKIKTIGDAYMAVAGVPEQREDDVEVAAEMALAMRETISQIRWPSGDPMRVRIGMATGPAVAGVIGQRKFAYDLWGDTVNTVARLESNGVPNEIQVSESVYRQLGDRYVFSDVTS